VRGLEVNSCTSTMVSSISDCSLRSSWVYRMRSSVAALSTLASAAAKCQSLSRFVDAEGSSHCATVVGWLNLTQIGWRLSAGDATYGDNSIALQHD